MTKKGLFLLGFVIVIFITIIGCPVSGSSFISSGNFPQNNQEYIPVNILGYDINTEYVQKIAANTTLIPYYYPGNDLSHITEASFLEWFNNFVTISGLNDHLGIMYMRDQMKKGYFYSWDELNLSFASLGYLLTFKEGDNAGTKSTSDNSIMSGGSTSTGNNNLSITFDPTCIPGETCYSGNGNTGPSDSGNTPTPPQPP